MRSFRPSRVAIALAVAMVAGSASAQFSNSYFFGDSLTDSGSFKPVLPPGTGLFSTNPGPVWSQVIADRLGTTAKPADQGGTNYAQGGARVTQLPGVPDQPPTGTAVPIATQVTQFLAKGPIDSNALYSLWGGADDIFYNVGAAQAGAITAAQVQANVGQSAVELVAQVARLQAAGARNVIVWNMPNIGTTPFGVGSGAAATFTGLSGLFNSTLTAGLNALGGNVLRLDVNALFTEVQKNPAAFGLTNVAATACGATPSLLCTAANLVTPTAAQTYLFADGVHPTTAGHKALAEYAESFIEGPSYMAVLGEAPIAVEKANFRALDGRMQSGLNAPRVNNKFDVWVAYDYANPDYSSGFVNGSADVNTISIGADMKVSDEILVGLQYGYSENKGNFGNSNGDFKLKENMGTVYAGWGRGPWWAGLTLFAGDLDYSVNRNIRILELSRTEQGRTNGYQVGGRLLGGYWFQYDKITHGPYVNLNYQKIVVNQFSEQGNDSTALTYGRQDRDSFTSSLGWQASGQWGMVRPFARVTWEWESEDGSRSINATPVGAGGTYSIGTYQPDSNWVLFNLGASADFGGNVTGYINGAATASKSDGDYWAVTVGVRIPLK
jgi:outer membrane lipase/esterase